MLNVEMSPIQTEAEDGTELEVEGGWTLKVVEVEPRERDGALLIRRYQRYGFPPWKAKEHAEARLQEIQTAGYVRRVRAFIRRCAQEYFEDFGDLGGFEPERLQDLFLPAENYGRRGNPEAAERMKEMRRDFEERAAQSGDQRYA